MNRKSDDWLFYPILFINLYYEIYVLTNPLKTPSPKYFYLTILSQFFTVLTLCFRSKKMYAYALPFSIFVALSWHLLLYIDPALVVGNSNVLEVKFNLIQIQSNFFFY